MVHARGWIAGSRFKMQFDCIVNQQPAHWAGPIQSPCEVNWYARLWLPMCSIDDRVLHMFDVLQAQLGQPWSGSDKLRTKYSYGT